MIDKPTKALCHAIRLGLYIILLPMILMTIGCGSSGGSDPNPSADTTPNAFTFNSQTGVAVNTVVESNLITISGINSAASISITGEDGEYSINDGDYTDDTGTVNNGDSIKVRVTSSTNYNTSVSTTLNVGGLNGVFNVATVALNPSDDTTPDTFTITPKIAASINTLTESEPFTVSGINIATPVSISGADGMYSINGGAYTNEAGTINVGAIVRVRLTSGPTQNVSVSTTLTIGGVTATFSVTVGDLTPIAFTFAAQTDMEPLTVITSNSITVNGINAPSPVSISGASGMYSKNNGAYTNAAGTVNSGDTITVQLTSSSQSNTTTSVTLTIGGVSSTFNVTTKAGATISDTTPDPFNFNARTDVELNSPIVSESITVSGINEPSTISITGGSYSINNMVFKSVAGTVIQGDTVRVRLTSSSIGSTTTSTTLTIGGVTATFNATTKAGVPPPDDTTPDSFTFTQQTDAELSTTYTSNAITVTGINAAAPITITGGMYSINSGAYTSIAGTVNAGNTVTVRLTSSSSYETAAIANLAIGGVAGSFTVTTKAAAPVDDSTPDTFVFNAQTGVALNTVTSSNSIMVTGINVPTQISISDADGTYSINGGAYTSSNGTVQNGDIITVRATSSTDYNTGVSTVLTIGGVSGAFNVTSELADTTPNSFTFTAQTGVDVSTVITSNQITVSGINAAADISISGADGAYSINGGAYTSSAGTVNDGDTVAVRVTSSASDNTLVSSTLTIGGVAGVFNVTTKGVGWKSVGLGGRILSLAIDPSNSQTVYVGTFGGGVNKSVNGGNTWISTNTGITSNSIPSLAIDPTNSQVIYAGTWAGGLCKSVNGGSTWSAVITGITAPSINSLAIDSTNSQTVYAGSVEGVFKSVNGGSTWSAINTGLTSIDICALAIDPTNSQTVYAGTDGSGLFKSVNGGSTWSAINTGLTDTHICAIAIDPTNSQTVYAGTDDGSGLFKSVNGGSTWSAANTGLTSYSSIESLAIDPTNNQTVYAGTDSGVFKSVNGGSTWSEAKAGLTDDSTYLLAIDPNNSQIIYTGAEDGSGVFKSVNGGSTWSETNTGLNAFTILSVVIDRLNSQTVYAGAGYSGVFKSINGGGTWSWSRDDAGLSDTFIFSLAIDPTNSQVVYAGTMDDGVYKSVDGGSTWNATNTGITTNRISLLAINPTNSQIIYAGSDIGSGLFKSVNGGSTWSAANTGLTSYSSIESLAIDPTNSQTVYAGTNNSGVFKSVNGGSTWSAANTGLIDTNIQSLAIDPTNSQTVYAGTNDRFVLFKSVNGGSTWSAANTGLTSFSNIISLAIDPINSQTVYAGTIDGVVFKSVNGGSTWSATNTGLTDTNIQSLAIDPTNGQTVYAGTWFKGVFKM